MSVLDQFPTELGTVKAQKKPFSCADTYVAKKKKKSFFHADFLIYKAITGLITAFCLC